MSSEPPILDTAVPEVPPPPPVTAEFARPVALGVFGSITTQYNNLGKSISTAQKTALSYDDEFWAVSGYERSAVIAALDQLETMIGQFQSSADALSDQAI